MFGGSSLFRIETDSEPESLTTAKPPKPGGVESATIVSSSLGSTAIVFDLKKLCYSVEALPLILLNIPSERYFV